jgi:hypothetical protein
MAAYTAARLRIRDELSASTGPELRAELEAALAAFKKEAGRSAEAGCCLNSPSLLVVTALFNGQQPISAPSTNL